jgi:hypothetical protein
MQLEATADSSKILSFSTLADVEEIARALKRTGAGTGPVMSNLTVTQGRDVA